MHPAGGSERDRCVTCGWTMNGTELEKIVSCPRVPTLPTVAVQVLEVTRDANLDFKEVARIIEKDQGIATKVLKTVNSSYYGLSRPCGTIHQAMVYLGVNSVRTIVLGFGLIEGIGKGNDEQFDYIDYWKRGVYTAVAAREIGQVHHRCDPDEAFLAGIMQDIGMVALARYFRFEYAPVMELAGDDHRKLCSIEQEELDVTHCRVGAEMAERWTLPPQHIEAIRHHHASDRAADEHLPFVRTVELANLCAYVLMRPDDGALLRSLARRAFLWFAMDDAQVTELVRRVREAAHELASLFKLNIGRGIDVEQLLTTAEDRLVETQFVITRENAELRKSNEELSTESRMDGLTNVANRKHFDLELHSTFEQARARRGRMAVIFCDADRFKNINDSFGHQTGDTILVEIAQRLSRAIGMKGLVARYGGEEFAVILPDCDRVEAARLGEHLRRAIEQSPVPVPESVGGPSTLNTTISVGVAAYDDDVRDLFTTPKLLLRVADQAVYAAKQSGRNCVRVFSHSKRSASRTAA